MAFQSVKRVEPYWYTPEDQKDLEGEEPMQFWIRCLTASEQFDVFSGQIATIVARDSFRICCTEIRNATKPNGKPCVNAAQFLMLPDSMDYVAEVGAVIVDNSVNTEEEKKTSSSE